MNKKFYVYRLKTDDNKIIYIGKGSGDRMLKHIQIANGNSLNKQKNPKLYNKILSTINMGGYIIPEIIFENEDEKKCLEKEIAIIKEIGLENLCNLTEGGEGTSGYQPSEETKEKMSKAKKKYWETQTPTYEEKSKRREKILNNKNVQLFKKGHNGFFKGKKLSEETKKKMSDAKKGKIKGPISEKRRQSIIDGIKNKKMKEEYYLSHEAGVEAAEETLLFIIKGFDLIKHGHNQLIINDKRYCLHTKLDINEDPLNMERIIGLNGTFEVRDFHDERTPITMFKKIN